MLKTSQKSEKKLKKWWKSLQKNVEKKSYFCVDPGWTKVFDGIFTPGMHEA